MIKNRYQYFYIGLGSIALIGKALSLNLAGVGCSNQPRTIRGPLIGFSYFCHGTEVFDNYYHIVIVSTEII